jgi:hypothetical protein
MGRDFCVPGTVALNPLRGHCSPWAGGWRRRNGSSYKLRAQARVGKAEQPVPTAQLQRFLSAAASMDSAGIEARLDQAFALGSFEHVAESWLFPALEALGEGWALEEIVLPGSTPRAKLCIAGWRLHTTLRDDM